VVAKLDPARFLRVHRSVIINVERIARVKAEAHGEYRIILRDGTRLTSSRAYNSQIRRLMG
jgi:two-component system, LytTR family, response regulator